MRFRHTSTGIRQETTKDSITLIRLGPDHPPITKTVGGTVPVTISGSPHISISADGHYGFVAYHSYRWVPGLPGERPLPADHKPNVLTVIDLQADDLRVVDQVKFSEAPWMVDLHPDGDKAIVGVGAAFHIYSVEKGRARLVGKAKAPGLIYSFDVSPRGDRILTVTVKFNGWFSNPQLHLFSLQGTEIKHLQRIEALKGLAPMDRLFSPRISPDGKRAIVLQDWGTASKGTLDDVLIVDLDRKTPAVTECVRQVGDGLESLAIHPSGRFAVVSCLERTLEVVMPSRLAVIDLTARPARLLSHIPIETSPEGIDFTPDGKRLFVGTTGASQIAVFDVEGFELRRSPFVLPTGQSHAALAIWAEKGGENHKTPGNTKTLSERRLP
jgi:DNA-binding beta-propeller fold protein YncE